MLSTSSLSIADGYLIVNTLLSRGGTETGRGGVCLTDLRRHLIELMGKSKAGREMLEADERTDGGTDGMNAEYEHHQYSGNLESLTRHSCANSWSHSFSSRKRTTCGASYKWQIPTRAAPSLRSSPHWTDLHMHTCTLAHEYVVGGPFSFF